MACSAQEFDIDKLNKYVWCVQATIENYTQDQLIQFVDICLHRLHGDLQPADIIQCFHDAFQRSPINEKTINVTTEDILVQFQKNLEHGSRTDEAKFNKAFLCTPAINETSSVLSLHENEDIAFLFHGCLFYLFLFVQRIALNGARCCLTTPNDFNREKESSLSKGKENKNQPASNLVAHSTCTHLLVNILDTVLHRISFITTSIHEEENHHQSRLCNMLQLDIWSSILCEIVYRLLLDTDIISSSSLSTTGSASELSRPARTALHRFLDIIPDLLLLFLHGEENIIRNSCFLKSVTLFLICPQIPRSSLHLNTRLQQAFLTWILSYAGDPSLHRVFTLLGCYINLPKLNISDRSKDGLPRDTLLTDSLWNGLMNSALENIQKDLEVFLQLDNKEQLEDYALSCIKHTSILRERQPKLHLLVCHGFPLKQLLKIIIQFLESILNTIKTYVELQTQIFFSLLTTTSTTYSQKKKYHEMENILHAKEKIFKDIVSLILSVLSSVPKCYLLLYSRMLQRLLLTCLGLNSKHMSTWNQVCLQETYTLQSWVFQCRYSTEIYCILDCLLCKISSLFEQGKLRDLVFAHLQQTLAFIVNQTPQLLLLFQKYVDGNKEQFTSNVNLPFNSISQKEMALHVRCLLRCVCSNQFSGFQTFHLASQEDTSYVTTKFLSISLDVLSVTRTLLTQLDHKLTDISILAQCDEHALRLLWQAALTGSTSASQTDNWIDIWKTPSLTKMNVDRRLLLLEHLIEFLQVSHVYHYGISPTFLSVVISVLNRVKPKCRNFIPTFYSGDENCAHLAKNVEEKIIHFTHLLKCRFYGHFQSEGIDVVEQARIKSYLKSFLSAEETSFNPLKTDTRPCDATLHVPENEKSSLEKWSTFNPTINNSSHQESVSGGAYGTPSSHTFWKASESEKAFHENARHSPIHPSFIQSTTAHDPSSSFSFTTVTNGNTTHDAFALNNGKFTTEYNSNEKSIHPPLEENLESSPTSSVHSISSHNTPQFSDSHIETCHRDEMMNCATPFADSSDTDVSERSSDVQFSSIHLLQSYDEALSTLQPEHQCEVTSVLQYCGFNVSDTPKKEEPSQATLHTPQVSCDSDTHVIPQTVPQKTVSDSLGEMHLDTNSTITDTLSPSKCTVPLKICTDSENMNDDDLLAALDKKKCIFLFDMDGTLTKATCKCDISVARVLEKLKKYVNIGIVSGSSLDTITYQFQPNNSSLTVYDIADYIFSQNGTVARFHGTCLGEDFNIQSHLGESQLQELLNFILRYIADLSIPIKRGTFIQLRTAMINISPIGRDCSLQEREAFFEYDKIHHVRLTLIQHLEKNFKHLNLRFAVGGQISIDCYPIGWDKSFCLRHLSDYDSIYFFGDKTSLGGNDYEIYNHPNVIGQTVKSPEDTVHHLEKFLNSLKKDD